LVIKFQKKKLFKKAFSLSDNNLQELKNMSIDELNSRKEKLMIDVDKLVKKKKKLYSNMDITSPMSIEEKSLTKEIANIYSEINTIILEKRNRNKKNV